VDADVRETDVLRDGSRNDLEAPLKTAHHLDPRTRLLLEGSIPGRCSGWRPRTCSSCSSRPPSGSSRRISWKLGTDALAGVALVFPLLMLMQMMSAGAMGGAISSAIARALGAGRRADANALVVHALAIAVAFGLLFTLTMLGGGRWLYEAMGGNGASLAAALTYSHRDAAAQELLDRFHVSAADVPVLI
jgi:hypothetical protein